MILRRLPDSRFSEVVRLWEGETVVLIGGGPSLTFEQLGRVRGFRCIAVNSAYLLAPWAAVLYAADSHWFRWHTNGIPVGMWTADYVRHAFASFAGQKCSIENSGGNITDDAVHMLRNKHHPSLGYGLSTDPRYLVTGANSGVQALNLAILAGAKKIILLGYDGKPDGDRTHMLGPHPRPTPEAAYPLYVSAMDAARKQVEELGVTVINASPGSAINAWQKMRLEDALEAR